MKIHSLKLNIKYCDDVLSGIKTFEVRKNDRDFQVGDLIKFIPINSSSLPCFKYDLCKHEILDTCYVITYILSDYGLKDGYVVLAIKEDKPDIEF